jgi:hypothetical protein
MAFARRNIEKNRFENEKDDQCHEQVTEKQFEIVDLLVLKHRFDDVQEQCRLQNVLSIR